jgi:hypothetical protein
LDLNPEKSENPKIRFFPNGRTGTTLDNATGQANPNVIY